VVSSIPMATPWRNAGSSGAGNVTPLRRRHVISLISLRARPSARRRGAPVVLIADDTRDTRELYGMYFASRGFDVLTADDGESAVQITRDRRPHVVVMDLAMPRVNGIVATQWIKQDRRTRRTRVIILTGYPYRAIEQGALESGADMFLTKPCLPEDLERHVREVLKPPAKR
jgi:two-component system, cell cycle response regulator DivK